MRRSELERLLAVGAGHSFQVEVREVAGCPGFVRTVWLHRGGAVLVEFDRWGRDEGGLYFRGQFASLDQAVAYLEQYLGRRFSDWSAADARYPARPAELGTPPSHERFLSALREGRIALPDPDHFTSALGAWRQHVPFPSRYER